MTRAPRWFVRTAIAAGAVLGVGGGLLLLARALLPSDAELAAQLSTRFEARTGVGLSVGAVHWSLLPAPMLVLSDLSTVQPHPITARRLMARLQVAPLWRREIAFDTLEAEGVVLPRASVRAFGGQGAKTGGKGLGFVALGGPWTLAARPVAHVQWRNIVWIDRRDIALAYDGEASFDALWRPREAEIRRPGAPAPARLRLERIGSEDRWTTLIDIGGGSWNGEARFETPSEGGLRLSAELEPRGVDVESLVQTFGRRTPVAGKAYGHSTLVAEAPTPGKLLASLHTRTRFSLKPAALTRLDLAKAVKSAGISRGGRTPLDELSGTLDTQNTGDGTVMQYTDLKARSGVLTASGNVRLFNRKLDGEAAIDIVDGVVGVPLKIGGTASDPEVSLTGGALAGAAVGSAVLPGVGTAIGARIGQQVERLFGGKTGKRAMPAPPLR